MQILPTQHVFATQIGVTPKDIRNAAAAFQNATSPNNDAEALNKMLANLDLRQISPRELAQLGVQLLKAGAISENAGTAFVISGADFAADAQHDKIDAIAYFEKKFSVAEQAVRQGAQGLEFAQQFNRESLHAIYSLDDFLHNQSEAGRPQLGIDLYV